MTVRSEIGIALRDRLATVTAANGYSSDVKRVWYDDIPMGLDLAPEDLPAILMLDDGQVHEHLHGIIDVQWSIRLQLFADATATDAVMNQLLRDISKALWANSATAEVMDQFRAIHERIYQLESIGDETDLHMIDGNRVATAKYVIRYRTKPFDL